MKESSIGLWELWVEQAGSCDGKWRALFTEILIYLTSRLQTTDLKGSVIPCLYLSQAEVIVEGFNDEVFEEWRLAVQKGVKGDWNDLIGNRMHYFTLEPFGVAKDVKQPLFWNFAFPQRPCGFSSPYAMTYP